MFSCYTDCLYCIVMSAEYYSERKQSNREGEADRADSASVNDLMTTISHLPLQVHKQLPIINNCRDSLWAAVSSSSQPSVLCMTCAEMLVYVASFPSAQAKDMSVHLTLPNEFLIWFISRKMSITVDTAASVLGPEGSRVSYGHSVNSQDTWTFDPLKPADEWQEKKVCEPFGFCISLSGNVI